MCLRAFQKGLVRSGMNQDDRAFRHVHSLCLERALEVVRLDRVARVESVDAFVGRDVDQDGPGDERWGRVSIPAWLSPLSDTLSSPAAPA